MGGRQDQTHTHIEVYIYIRFREYKAEVFQKEPVWNVNFLRYKMHGGRVQIKDFSTTDRSAVLMLSF